MTDFQNPREQDPNFHRRMLLAFALVFLVITGSQWYMAKYGPKPQPKPAETQQQQAQPAGQPPAAPEAQVTAAPAQTAPATAENRQATAEQTFVVENDLYRITFTNKGAKVTSWVLKKYSDDYGKPLELVHPIAAPAHGYPLSLWTYDPAMRTTLNDALYATEQQGTLSAPATVTFEYAANGLTVRKSFRFDHSYVVQVETQVTQNGAHVQAYPAWPAGFGDQTVPVSYAVAKTVWAHEDTIERRDPGKVSGGATVFGPFHWAGVENQYFAAMFLPENPSQAAMVTLHNGIKIPENLNKPDPNKQVDVSVLGAAVGNQWGVTRGRFFVGPKDLDVLKAVTPQAGGPDLAPLVDFGFFGIIAKPLFLWLKWTYNAMVPNWGWAIIVLTIIINVALFPLKYSSMKSMLKMQKLQPQMKAIQERYKKYKINDPRRAEMNKEVGALYKQHNVNPIGGCLPMLLQLPFLFAFYSMLGVGIELRHAHFLWIKDLSSPDRFYILPILIMVSMFLMQRITPNAGMDPTQQRIMNIMMPVTLGVISWTLAAGLGVYWVASNLIAYVQQLAMNRTALGREVRAEAERRAARKSSRS